MLEIEKRIKWLQNKVKEANADGLAVAISGGVDSAVTAALAKKAFPNNTFGIFIGINSSTNAKRNYLRTINFLNIEDKSIDLTDSFENLVKNIFEIEDKYASLETYEEYEKTGNAPIDKSYLDLDNLNQIKGNIKARLRMIAIYAHAQKLNYLVLETSNLSEMIIGYYTKWGDGVGDIAPISDLYKSEVKKMAKELNIPEMIINSSPSADLWEGQTDEEELGFTYDELEKYNKNEKINKKSVEKIEEIINKNNHKKDGVYKYKDVK
ncbi:MAG: NAD(+) synthetase [Candidatus Tyloplasma litorale]|nr:MAG: NAD(+) synthetase [Mycoplasmatales bacterium]